MPKIYNTFEFICNLSQPKETEKFKSYEKKEFDSKWVKESLKLNAKIPTSSELITIEDGYYNKKDYSIEKDGEGKKNSDGTYTKGNKIKISWKDRANETLIEKVANYQKFVLDLSNNKERYDVRKAIEKLEDDARSEDDDKYIETIKKYFKIEIEDIKELISTFKETLEGLENCKQEFISRVDMIAKLRQLIKTELGTNTVFKITGDIGFSEWNGKVYRTFNVKKIEKALPTDKLKLNGNLDLYFNQQSLNQSLFEDTKKYIVNAWTMTYDSQLKTNIYVPVTLVADGSRLDLTNEKHTKKLEGIIKRFKVEDDEKIYQIAYEVKFANGSERVEITMEDLTETQREYIEDDLMTFEDAVNELGGNKFGDRVNETRLFKPSCLKDFPNGAIETTLEIEDFIIEREKAEDKTITEDKDTTGDNEEDIDDLI